jgi:hypothetical protein
MLKNGQLNVTDEKLLVHTSPLTTAEMAGTEIHEGISVHYKGSVLLRQKMCNWIDMLKNGQLNVTDEELLVYPSPLTLLKWQITCTLVMVLPVNSSIRDFTSMKSVHCGFQDN